MPISSHVSKTHETERMKSLISRASRTYALIKLWTEIIFIILEMVFQNL